MFNRSISRLKMSLVKITINIKYERNIKTLNFVYK